MNIHVHLSHFDRAVAVEREFADKPFRNFLHDVGVSHRCFQSALPSDSSICEP